MSGWTFILHTIEGDLSLEIRSQHGGRGHSTAEVDERLMQSMQGLRATTCTMTTMTIDTVRVSDVGGGGAQGGAV